MRDREPLPAQTMSTFDWNECIVTLKECTEAAERREMPYVQLERLVQRAKQCFDSFFPLLPPEVKALILSHLGEASGRKGHALLRAPAMAVCAKSEYALCFRMLTGVEPWTCATRLSAHKRAVRVVGEAVLAVLRVYETTFGHGPVGIVVFLQLVGSPEFRYERSTDGAGLGWALALFPDGVHPSTRMPPMRVPDEVPLTSFRVNVHECCLACRRRHSPFTDTDTFSLETGGGRRVIQHVNAKPLCSVEYQVGA